MTGITAFTIRTEEEWKMKPKGTQASCEEGRYTHLHIITAMNKSGSISHKNFTC